jgi:hypothetical protein
VVERGGRRDLRPPSLTGWASCMRNLAGSGSCSGCSQIGPSTHQQVMRSAQLFASDVMPALRLLGVAAERNTA